MKDDIEIVTYTKTDLSNSMLIVAFPTVGLVGLIAGRFVIDALGLEEIGFIESPYNMPATVIHKGIPMPPVRIYAGEKKCGPNGTCSQLIVILSEFMPALEQTTLMAERILQWSRQNKCKYIMTLEGTNAVGEKASSNPKVFGLGSTSAMRELLKKYKIEESEEGLITGVTGVLLYKGVQSKLDVLCLLSEVHVSYPDSRGAGRLLEKMNLFLPEIKIDPEPLYKEAETIEHMIQKFMQQASSTSERMQRKGIDAMPRMYG
jgi:uncharacterized protein